MGVTGVTYQPGFGFVANSNQSTKGCWYIGGTALSFQGRACTAGLNAPNTQQSVQWVTSGTISAGASTLTMGTLPSNLTETQIQASFATTNYANNLNVTLNEFVIANGNVYQLTGGTGSQPWTTAATGAGPQGGGHAIHDGTAVFSYVNMAGPIFLSLRNYLPQMAYIASFSRSSAPYSIGLPSGVTTLQTINSGTTIYAAVGTPFGALTASIQNSGWAFISGYSASDNGMTAKNTDSEGVTDLHAIGVTIDMGFSAVATSIGIQGQFGTYGGGALTLNDTCVINTGGQSLAITGYCTLSIGAGCWWAPPRFSGNPNVQLEGIPRGTIYGLNAWATPGGSAAQIGAANGNDNIGQNIPKNAAIITIYGGNLLGAQDGKPLVNCSYATNVKLLDVHCEQATATGAGNAQFLTADSNCSGVEADGCDTTALDGTVIEGAGAAAVIYGPRNRYNLSPAGSGVVPPTIRPSANFVAAVSAIIASQGSV